MDTDDLPMRRRPARQPIYEAGNLSPIIFLTVCTAGRKPILASSVVHELMLDCWRRADRWSVGKYVILPDHIHLFCAPATAPPTDVRKWVQYWKALASRQWHNPRDQSIWQIDVWDTQLRRSDHYGAKWEYVRNNPVRHGVCRSAEEWPYQGEIHILHWHDA